MIDPLIEAVIEAARRVCEDSWIPEAQYNDPELERAAYKPMNDLRDAVDALDKNRVHDCNRDHPQYDILCTPSTYRIQGVS